MRTPEEYDPAAEQARLVIGDIFELCEHIHKNTAPNFKLRFGEDKQLRPCFNSLPGQFASNEDWQAYEADIDRSTQLITKETNNFMHQALQLISQPHGGRGKIIAHPSLLPRFEEDTAFDTLNFRMHDEESFMLWHWQTSLAPSIGDYNLDTKLLDIERVIMRTDSPTNEHLWDIAIVNGDPFICYSYYDIRSDHKDSSHGYLPGAEGIAELHEAKTVLNYLVNSGKSTQNYEI